MPTVHRWQGYRFFFYSREPNEPPHIHAEKGNCQIKFWLEDQSIARVVGCSPKELARLSAEVKRNSPMLIAAWYRYFGER